MIHLIFGLHMYQPPTQTPEVLDQIKSESYLPLLTLISDHPNAFFNLDVCMSVIELAQRYGHNDLIEKLRECQKKGKINLVTSGMYHPIFPLLTDDVIVRQVRINNKGLAKLFHDCENYKTPKGVFPPEMAFSKDILEPLKKAGGVWTITDDVPYDTFYGIGNVPFSKIFRYNGMYIFLRSNKWSNDISFKMPNFDQFYARFKYDQKKWHGGGDGYVVIWMDFETYGHHDRKTGKHLIPDLIKPILDNLGDDLKLVSPEYVIEKFESVEKLIPPGSWSTWPEHFRQGIYYPLWNHPDCEFHKYWWHLASLCYRIATDSKSKELIRIYDKVINSCQCWQYSYGNKDLAGLGIPMFSEIIEKSAHPLRNDAAHALKVLKRLVE